MMKWIERFDLFLFDFDGLLADTERLHYRAYKQMCHNRGFTLPWDFIHYCQIGHSASLTLEQMIYAACSGLQAQEPNWSVLYREKTQQLEQLLKTEGAPLMPGVESLLNALQQGQKKRAVVTHSAKWIIDALRGQHPVLNTIPHWITREDYKHPKPNPECYQIAIERLGCSGDKIIGFEDSPKGTEALLGTTAQATIITAIPHDHLPNLLQRGVKHYASLEELG